MPFTVALVGRPNVGKSTLFNKLTRTQKAIVHDMPGVTRDRKYGFANIGPLEFDLIDTPGLEESEKSAIEYRMMKQTESAIDEADCIFMIVDGRAGITPMDQYFAKWIIKKGKKVFLLVNKSEGGFVQDNSYYKLGCGQPIPISAEHGDGISTLYDVLEPLVSEVESVDEKVDHDCLRIVIAGRPNTGKSTFINSLLKEERVLTGPEAGVTRDSIEIDWEYKSQKIKLVDTAGLRRKANVKKSLEKLSVSDTLRSIRFANTVVLMLDSTCPLEAQDLTIANLAIKEGRGLLIAVNKSDLIQDKKAFEEELNYRLEMQLSQLKGLPVVYLSALYDKNVEQVIDKSMEVYAAWNRRLTTGQLNRWLISALENHQLPLMSNGRRLRIKYATQIKTRPPTFKFFANKPEDVPLAYQKYLLNDLRNAFDLFGIAIRIKIVGGNNPYN